VTDRRRHVPPRTLTPPRKQLSCTSSALARISYGGGACGAATAASRDDVCETSSAEAELRATLSLILSGVAGLAQLQWWPRPCNARHSEYEHDKNSVRSGGKCRKITKICSHGNVPSGIATPFRRNPLQIRKSRFRSFIYSHS